MRIADLARRALPPEPWLEGEKIPWHEADFSRRMLAEHLSQAHDAASRRTQTIERQVEWLHASVLAGRTSRVLDLCCGPGLYTSRLAARGHACTGIDFAPASIAYASQRAERDGLDCRYRLEDVREARFDRDLDLVMLIHGEFNVFRRAEAADLLARAAAALAPGGVLVLEPHTFEFIRERGQGGPSWYAAEHGLFSDEPHVCLSESFWIAEHAVAVDRWYVIDAASGAVTRHAGSMQAYSVSEYRALLGAAGFRCVEIHPSLEGVERSDGRMALIARRDTGTL